MVIAVGSDHAGFNLKEAIKRHLEALGHQVLDQGVFSTESADYPTQAAAVARTVADGRAQRGVLVCGSGIGMCMTANRFGGVRAALAATLEHARLGRAHNDANVLCLGERLTPEAEALAAVDVFLATAFEGGRHQRRIDAIDQVAGQGR
ncbi:MAG: ribose 5-phosphate isomerase B [Thermodesulfobacteriota bacterium]